MAFIQDTGNTSSSVITEQSNISDGILTLYYKGTPNRVNCDAYDSEQEISTSTSLDLTGLKLYFDLKSQIARMTINSLSIKESVSNKVVATLKSSKEITSYNEFNFNELMNQNNISFQSSCSGYFTLTINYEYLFAKNGSNQTTSGVKTSTFILSNSSEQKLTFKVFDNVLESLEIKSYPKLTFIDGEIFDYSNLNVYGKYYMRKGECYFYKKINNYSISKTSSDIIKFEDGNIQFITISYLLKTISYSIEVVGLDLPNCYFIGTKSDYAIIGQNTNALVKPTGIYVAYTNEDYNEEITDITIRNKAFTELGNTDITYDFTSPTTNLSGSLSYIIGIFGREEDVLIVQLCNSNHEIQSSMSLSYLSEFSLDGYYVKISYNNGNEIKYGLIQSNKIVLDNETLDCGVVNESGSSVTFGTKIANSQKIYLRTSYKGIESTSNEISLNVTNIPVCISSNITQLSNKKTTDTFSKNGITITYITSDSETDVTDDCIFSLNEGQVFGNTTQIKVTYTNEYEQELYLYINVNIVSKTLSSISVTTQPSKLSYVEGDALTINGMVVTAYYENGYSSETIDSSLYSCYLGTTSGVSVGGNVKIADNGKKIIVVYGNKQAETNAISVSALTMTDISITGVQTTAYIGDKLDKSNIKCLATMNNGYQQEVDKDSLVFSFDGTFTEEGNKSITISYTYSSVTKTKTFTISVGYATLTSIKVEPNNFGLTTGDSWGVSNLSVYPVYENGYVGSAVSGWTHDAIPFITGGVVNDSYGLNTFRVHYSGLYCVVNVSVNKNAQIKALSIKTNGMTYNIGDSYTARDIDVFVQYVGDSEWYEYNSYSTNPSVGTLFRSAGIKNITISAGDLSKTYQINVVSPVDKSYVDTTDYKIAFNIKSLTIDGETINFGTFEDGNRRYPLFKENDLDTSNNYNGNNAENDCIGYLEFGINNSSKLGHLVLFKDPINPIEGDGNIVVKFPHYIEGYADKINKSTFGKIYNGRLFVSGNPNQPNYDWRTSEINTAQVDNYEAIASGDFTYFADLHENAYGTDETKVLGYDNYSDGTLIVVKQDSKNEATIYYRKATNTIATNSSGDSIEDSVEDNYPCYDINTNGGIGCVSLKGVANYLGDTIFITKQGIKRLTSKNTYNNEKITIDVSTFINSKITKEELENSYLYTFKDTLLLKTNRGIYVAYKELRDDNEYEWYFLSNIDSSLFFELDNQLYFGDKNGNIKRFTDEIFVDKSRVFISNGGVLSNGFMVTSNNKYNEYIKEGNQLHLMSGSNTIFASLGKFISYNYTQNVSGNYNSYKGFIKKINDKWCIELDIDDRFFDGREIYIDSISGTGIDTNRKYYLNKLDGIEHRFYITDGLSNNKNIIDLEEINNFRIKIVVNDISMCFISSVEPYESGKQFKLKDNYGKDIEIVSTGTSWSGAITSNVEKVSAYYVTRPFDMNSTLYSKTVYMWSIANDTDLASYMDVGFYINSKSGDYEYAIKTASGSKAFDFNFTNFNAVQFTSDKLPHIYNRQKTLPNIGFIRYIFKNEEDTNMVLSQMQLIYTYGQVLKGVN